TWRFDHLESVLSLRDAAGWLFHDRFVLRGGGHYDGLGFTESQPYFATVIVVADGPCAEFANAVTTAGQVAGATVAAAPLPRRGRPGARDRRAGVRRGAPCRLGDGPTAAPRRSGARPAKAVIRAVIAGRPMTFPLHSWWLGHVQSGTTRGSLLRFVRAAVPAH